MSDQKCDFCHDVTNVWGHHEMIEIEDLSPVVRGGFYHRSCLQRKADAKSAQAELIRNMARRQSPSVLEPKLIRRLEQL